MIWDGTLYRKGAWIADCMMYKTDHHLADVEKEKYLQTGDSRTRGGYKFYQKRATSEAYRNSLFFPQDSHRLEQQQNFWKSSARVCLPNPPATDTNFLTKLYIVLKSFFFIVNSHLERLLCQLTCCSFAEPTTFH